MLWIIGVVAMMGVLCKLYAMYAERASKKQYERVVAMLGAIGIVLDKLDKHGENGNWEDVTLCLKHRFWTGKEWVGMIAGRVIMLDRLNDTFIYEKYVSGDRECVRFSEIKSIELGHGLARRDALARRRAREKHGY